MAVNVNKARATAIPADNSVQQARTWTYTLAISATLLAIMYGLAFWHEARGEAAREQAVQPAPIAAASTH